MTRIPALLAATAVAMLALSPASAETGAGAPTGVSGLKVVNSIGGPDGGWDYVSFDAARRRVYVSHGNEVLAIDADSGALTPALAAGAHMHAIVPIPGADVLVTTNGGDATAKIIAAASGALKASVSTAKDPDGAVYDPFTGLVAVVCGDSGEIDLIDPKAATLAGAIPVGEALEFAASDGHGRLFVNEEEKNAVAVIDLASRKVVAAWPMDGCHRPTGLAAVAGGRLIAACGNGVAKILDQKDGREIASLAIGIGPDAVIYDPTRALAYIPSGRSGTLAVIALSGPLDNTVIDTVTTRIGARTGAVDPKTGRIWLPSAEYGPASAPGGRPVIKPGTFQVLVVGRS